MAKILQNVIYTKINAIKYYRAHLFCSGTIVNLVTMNSILENIDTIRRNKGYSQEYIATQIGMKQAGFSLIMSGERELKYNTLLQIAKVLQVSVIDLITFPEKYVPSKGGGMSTEAVLQIKLDSDKKDQILNIVFGEQIAELLKSR